jgi:thioredoxin reductase (NADPH)
LPFVTPGEKPSRRDALAYYRAVVRYFGIPIRQYEPVSRIEGKDGAFVVHTNRRGVDRQTAAKAVIVATGYWGSPNRLGVPGEDLPHVSHAYREGHYAFQQDAVVVGGGNSAAEAALDLWRAGARVTLVHFGPTWDKRIKPWVLPDVANRIAEGSIAACWNSRV